MTCVNKMQTTSLDKLKKKPNQTQAFKQASAKATLILSETLFLLA